MSMSFSFFPKLFLVVWKKTSLRHSGCITEQKRTSDIYFIVLGSVHRNIHWCGKRFYVMYQVTENITQR